MISNEDMITDRTQEDIDKAKQIRKEKIMFDENGQPVIIEPLTEEEKTILQKGFITYKTLNRIEQKQDELKNLFNTMGYWSTGITNKTDWTSDDIFYKSDFQRIIDNENVLKRAFFTIADTPKTPDISFHYEDINSLEKILYDLDVMINDVKSNYRICGTFECGEE